MAFEALDFCWETTTPAPGTGSFTLAGAVQGARTFNSAHGNGATLWYTATNGTAREVGIGTFTSPATLARTSILASTNGGAAVNFSSGAISVFEDLPASKAKVLERLAWAAAAITPPANDGTALGISGTAFSDLFLALGGVIDWNAGDVLATHSSNALAFTGASSGYSFDALLNLSGAAAGQISFPATQNASAGANTLDDYEEGTWTPANANVTLTGVVGTYTKIGRFVSVDFDVTWPTTANGAAAAITGLPFAVSGNSGGVMSAHNAGQNVLANLTASEIRLYSWSLVQFTNVQMSTFRFIGGGSYHV